MSTIDAVPPEILGEIFSVLALPSGSKLRAASNEEVICIGPGAPPLVLSQVSTRWRRIALSHPAIWACFKILLKTTVSANLTHLTALWLERAADQLLSFTVWMDPYVYLNKDASEAAEGVFRLLGMRIAKWRSVTLVLPGARVPDFVAKALCGQIALYENMHNRNAARGLIEDKSPNTLLPLNLEHASLTLGNKATTFTTPSSPTPFPTSTTSLANPDTSPAPSITSFFLYAPKLRSLAWSARAEWGCWDTPQQSAGVAVEKLLGTIQMHRHNLLTDVRLDTWITLRAALGVLEACPLVERFEVNHFVWGDVEEEEDAAAAAGSDSLINIHWNASGESFATATGTPTATQTQAVTDILAKYTPTTPLHLPHLSSLSIYQLHLSPSLAALLSRLSCPALSFFAFSCGFVGDDSDHHWPQEAFHEMITRNYAPSGSNGGGGGGVGGSGGGGGSRLKKLFLEYSGITEAQLTQCLEDTSETLESLELYEGRGCVCVTDALLQRLCAPPMTIVTGTKDVRVHRAAAASGYSVWTPNATSSSEDVLCPNLKRLVMHYVVDCDDGALTNMLLSRLPHATVQNYYQQCDIDSAKRVRVNDNDGINDHCGADKDANNVALGNITGTYNSFVDCRDRCARLEFVDAMFSKLYLPGNSVDAAFLRMLKEGVCGQ